MLIVPVNDVGAIGLISDRKPHELPLNAWSTAVNIRFRDGFAEKFLGDATHTTTPVQPYWLLPIPTSTSFYWLIAGLAKVYGYDGSTQADITRATGGDYGATATLNWTGGVFNGIPVLNNAVDPPQMWSPVLLSQKLQNLTAWPANTTCRVLRAFKTFLVAGDVIKSGTRYRQMVKWSHSASLGTVPSSWDETDPTKDAGEWSLAETGGSVVDFLPLRDLNIVYKDDAVYKMQYIGGDYIFRFSVLTTFAGILSRRCAVEFQPGYHAFMSPSDLLRHDGQQVVSILNSRLRRWYERNLDVVNWERSFACVNSKYDEVWFCFPERDNVHPTLAIVWRWSDNTLSIRELNNIAHLAQGVLISSSDTWDSDTGVWDDDTSVWDAMLYNPAISNLVGVVPTASALHVVDVTDQFDGISMTATLERTGIGVPLRANTPPDFTTMKFFSELWPRIEGTDGGVVKVYVGVQDSVDAPVTWQAPQDYVIGLTEKIAADIAGRLLAVRFESTTDVEWRLHGYEIHLVPDGEY